MFSSCLKNIEPEGLADLRGAKAELLRAQTAVEAANAAKVNADAALVLAQAKVQEAIAKQEEAKAAYEAAVARLKELEVEKQTAINQVEIEKAIAEAQAAITEAEAKAAKAAAEAEKELLTVLQDVAKLQIEYENALKNLALAAATLTDPQQAQLAAMQQTVEDARVEVAELTVEFEHAAIELAYALSLVDDEAAKQTVVRYAEIALLKAQAVLEGAVEAEAIAKAAVELDLPTIADWRTKGNEYWAEAEKLEADYWKRYGEIKDAMSAMEDSLAADGAIGKKAADYTAYTGHKFDEETGVFSQIADASTETFEIPAVAIKAPVTADGDAIADVADFKLDVTSYTYGKEAEVVKKFETALKNLAGVNAVSYEIMIASEKAVVAESKNDPVVKYNVARYNDAVAAYTAGDVLPYFTKYVFDEDYDLTAAVKEYNDAVAVFDAAVKKYHAELEKYSPDFAKETTAALAAKNKAVAEAASALAAAYQKAYDDNKVASKKALKDDAKRVRNAAQASYNSVENAATSETSATVDDIKTFVKNYDAATADEAAKAKYEVWSVWNAKIVAAENVLTAAKKAYDDAVKAADKAAADYEAAKATAYGKYEEAVAKADEAYNKAIADVAAKSVGFTAEYKQNLEEQIMNAATDLYMMKMPAILQYADKLTENTDPVDVVVDVENPTTGYPATYPFTSVPEFMVDATYDGTTTTYAFKAIAVADFVDKEYFKNKEIAKFADNIVKIGSSEFVYAGYPLVMPSADEASAYYESNKTVTPKPAYYAEMEAADKIAGYEASIEALEQLPDFVKAIEAAKAEFEALVKENAAKLAADKAEVEAFYARYIPLKEKNDKELEAMKAKTDVMVARFNAIGGIIAAYCEDADEDYLTEALYAQYEAAAMMLTFAETSVYEAEVNLEKAKNGLLTLVEFAQMNYDAVSTDLAVAIAKLEGATAALENAIAVIYGVEPVAPQAPVTPPADDDTTDEGGEAEGGEGEGGEETPAE